MKHGRPTSSILAQIAAKAPSNPAHPLLFAASLAEALLPGGCERAIITDFDSERFFNELATARVTVEDFRQLTERLASVNSDLGMDAADWQNLLLKSLRTPAPAVEERFHVKTPFSVDLLPFSWSELFAAKPRLARQEIQPLLRAGILSYFTEPPVALQNGVKSTHFAKTIVFNANRVWSMEREITQGWVQQSACNFQDMTYADMQWGKAQAAERISLKNTAMKALGSLCREIARSNNGYVSSNDHASLEQTSHIAACIFKGHDVMRGMSETDPQHPYVRAESIRRAAIAFSEVFATMHTAENAESRRADATNYCDTILQATDRVLPARTRA